MKSVIVCAPPVPAFKLVGISSLSHRLLFELTAVFVEACPYEGGAAPGNDPVIASPVANEATAGCEALNSPIRRNWSVPGAPDCGAQLSGDELPTFIPKYSDTLPPPELAT